MKTMIVMTAMSVLSLLSACNTVAGAGKDVQKIGQKTTEAAQETSKDLKEQK